MGLTCKSIGKMRSLIRKVNNELLKEKQLNKQKKKDNQNENKDKEK